MSYLGITARAFGDEGTFSRTGDAHHRHEKVIWASATMPHHPFGRTTLLDCKKSTAPYKTQ
jgi:hypothetical protein